MKKIILFAILLFSLSSRAQVTLAMSQNDPGNLDTVLAWSADTYTVWVKNLSNSIAFNDVLNIQTSVRNSMFPSLLDSVGYYTTGPSGAVINPGDSVAVSLTANYNIDSVQGYRYGIDVIVVWPFASSALTGDSLEFVVFIMDPAGIAELDIHDIIKLYPNPSTSYIHLDNDALEDVRIYDPSGKMVLCRKKENCINAEGLAPGMYYLDILLSDKKHYSIKFLKQKNGSE